MGFTKKSGLVHAFAILILGGYKTLEEVPNILNLRDAVAEYLTDMTV